MTTDEIDRMEMGPDLDVLVAEKVHGKKPCKFTITGIISTLSIWQCEHQSPENCYPEDKSACLEKYSEEIGAAWKVVEHLRGLELYLIMNDTMGSYRARFFGSAFPIDDWVRAPDNKKTAWAKTAPLAICRAALKASLV